MSTCRARLGSVCTVCTYRMAVLHDASAEQTPTPTPTVARAHTVPSRLVRNECLFSTSKHLHSARRRNCDFLMPSDGWGGSGEPKTSTTRMCVYNGCVHTRIIQRGGGGNNVTIQAALSPSISCRQMGGGACTGRIRAVWCVCVCRRCGAHKHA